MALVATEGHNNVRWLEPDEEPLRIILDALGEACGMIVSACGLQIHCTHMRHLLAQHLLCQPGTTTTAPNSVDNSKSLNRKMRVLGPEAISGLEDNMATYGGIIEASLAALTMLFSASWPSLAHPSRVQLLPAPEHAGGVVMVTDTPTTQGLHLGCFVHQHMHGVRMPGELCAAQMQLLRGSPFGSRTVSVPDLYSLCCKLVDCVVTLHTLSILHGDLQPDHFYVRTAAAPPAACASDALAGCSMEVQLGGLENALFLNMGPLPSSNDSVSGPQSPPPPASHGARSSVYARALGSAAASGRRPDAWDDLGALGLMMLEACLGSQPEGMYGLQGWASDFAVLSFLARGCTSILGSGSPESLSRESAARIRVLLRVRMSSDAGRAWYAVLVVAACAILARHRQLRAVDIRRLLDQLAAPLVAALGDEPAGQWLLLSAESLPSVAAPAALVRAQSDPHLAIALALLHPDVVPRLPRPPVHHQPASKPVLGSHLSSRVLGSSSSLFASSPPHVGGVNSAEVSLLSSELQMLLSGTHHSEDADVSCHASPSQHGTLDMRGGRSSTAATTQLGRQGTEDAGHHPVRYTSLPALPTTPGGSSAPLRRILHFRPSGSAPSQLSQPSGDLDSTSPSHSRALSRSDTYGSDQPPSSNVCGPAGAQNHDPARPATGTGAALRPRSLLTSQLKHAAAGRGCLPTQPYVASLGPRAMMSPTDAWLARAE